MADAPEIISRNAKRGGGRPPLLFIHGAFTGAWVWERYFLSYFADAGWNAHALSLRGHGDDRAPMWTPPGPGLRDYVDDVRAAMDQLGQDAILVGHSMGAAVIGKMLEEEAPRAVAMLAPPPPTGLTGPSFRLTVTQPTLFQALSIAQGFGPSAADPHALSRLFFADPDAAEAAASDIGMMQMESPRAILDMSWLDLPQTTLWPRLPAFVAVGAEDLCVSPGEAETTATALNIDMTTLPGLGHALMLDRRWRDCADAVQGWLKTLS